MLQVSDGASACLLMTRREAQRRSLPVLGVFRSFSAVGVPPGAALAPLLNCTSGLSELYGHATARQVYDELCDVATLLGMHLPAATH